MKNGEHYLAEWVKSRSVEGGLLPPFNIFYYCAKDIITDAAYEEGFIISISLNIKLRDANIPVYTIKYEHYLYENSLNDTDEDDFKELLPTSLENCQDIFCFIGTDIEEVIENTLDFFKNKRELYMRAAIFKFLDVESPDLKKGLRNE